MNLVIDEVDGDTRDRDDTLSVDAAALRTGRRIPTVATVAAERDATAAAGRDRGAGSPVAAKRTAAFATDATVATADLICDERACLLGFDFRLSLQDDGTRFVVEQPAPRGETAIAARARVTAKGVTAIAAAARSARSAITTDREPAAIASATEISPGGVGSHDQRSPRDGCCGRVEDATTESSTAATAFTGVATKSLATQAAGIVEAAVSALTAVSVRSGPAGPAHATDGLIGIEAAGLTRQGHSAFIEQTSAFGDTAVATDASGSAAAGATAANRGIVGASSPLPCCRLHQSPLRRRYHPGRYWQR